MKSRGSYVDAGIMLERWMQGCPDLTDVHLRELLTPIGPWKTGMYAISFIILLPQPFYHHAYVCVGRTPEETQRLQMIGTLMRQNMKVSLTLRIYHILLSV